MIPERSDVIATAIQLIYTKAFNSSDPTKDLWPWILISQLIQCITIVTSCVPYLKSLLVSFPSGLFMSDEIRRKGTNSSVRRRRYALHSMQGREKDGLCEHSSNSDLSSGTNNDGFNRASATTTVTAPGDGVSHMVGSVDLLDPQNANLIMKSTTFSVSHAPMD